MFLTYRPKTFNAEHTRIIEQARSILAEYEAAGFSMTLRQVYYQFVSRDLLPNTLQSYKRLGDILNDARMAGELSWESMEDRTRNVHEWHHETSPKDALKRMRRAYFVDRWENQPTRVMVLIEKDALAGVVQPVCGELDISYLACRGYLSQSEAWRLGRRIMQWREEGQDVVILHLGDHDPSGIDMTRDNRDRLSLFATDPEAFDYGDVVDPDYYGTHVEVRRLALNFDQVRRYRPPPNPAKTTDARAADYIKRFGTSSWELDALSPTVIADLIRDEVDSIRDDDLWEESGRRQAAEQATLDAFIASLGDDEESEDEDEE